MVATDSRNWQIYLHHFRDSLVVRESLIQQQWLYIDRDKTHGWEQGKNEEVTHDIACEWRKQ